MWESAPGEEYHAFTAERGGIWRNRGWPPQRLTGVGFTAQGFDVSLPYRWAITADHPLAGFIAAGIDTSGPLGSAAQSSGAQPDLRSTAPTNGWAPARRRPRRQGQRFFRCLPGCDRGLHDCRL